MDLLRLEQQRQALEQNLQKLRASLKHWQTLSFELEGFKEEIDAAPLDTPVDFDKLSKSYDGTLFNESEIRDLAGLDSQTPPRTAPQVLDMIDRRQDYISKNIETVQRQFWDAEAKLEELDFAAYQAGSQASSETASTGGGLLLTEIHEELDEEGNVISSSLSHPEENTAKLVESLRKAGVPEEDLKDVVGDGEDDSDAQSATSGTHAIPPPALVKRPYVSTRDTPKASKVQDCDSSPERPSIRKKSVSFSADTKPEPEPVRSESEDGKKTVSFNDKIAVMPAAPPPDNRTVSFSPKIEEIPADANAPQPDNRSVSFAPKVEEIPAEAGGSSAETQTKPDSSSQKELRTMFKPGEKVHEVNEEDEVTSTQVVVPENETEEDSRMRREMLNYHLNEVGHIVAEMNLVEGDDYEDYEDDEMEEDETTSASDFTSERPDEDTPYTSGHSDSDNDSEDEYGRTKKRVISDDYHKKMQELESRLIGNLGPTPSEQDVNAVDPDVNASDVRRLVIRDKRNSMSSNPNSDGENKAVPKKRVSFAEDLDVADESSIPPVKAAKHENTVPVADTVSERGMSSKPATTPSAPTPPKTSRFKHAHAAVPEPMDVDDEDYSGPPGKIIADTLLERTTRSRKVAAPSADEPDTIMQRRELAAEYYRRRNDLIRQQGGFSKAAADDDEDEAGELMEERPDGRVRKVSRFRAARIKPEGQQ